MFVMLNQDKNLQSKSGNFSEKPTVAKKIFDSKELEFPLNNFLQQIFKLPALQALKNSDNENKMSTQLKSVIINEIEKGILENLRNNFDAGEYDYIAFNDNPELTPELKVIVENHPRVFIQALFVKCKSEKTLRFWFEKVNLELPKDTWALAVNLGNNIVVLQYLKEKGLFEQLSREDKKGLLERAQRFEGKGLEYLKEQFKIENPSFK